MPGTVRRYEHPLPNETLTAFAARVLPGDDGAVARLQSWNLHLLLRRPIGDEGHLLPTDIVYLEPPAP